MGRRIISFLTMICIIFSTIITGNIGVEAKSVRLNDMQSHWANQQVEKWVEIGLASGYSNGDFKPDKSITRAEFMKLINTAFGYQEKATISFSDVSNNDWFYDEVTKAKQIGYISGYGDSTIKPNQSITREEAAVIINRVLQIDSDNMLVLNQMKDAHSIASWSERAVACVIENGYMGGYPDKTFRPDENITRAESIAMLDRVVGTLYNTPGEYGLETQRQIIKNNVTISSTGVVLKNIEIQGDLYLTEGIGDGEVELNNVSVTGKTLVKGGGENSIIIKNTDLGLTIIDTKTRKVRIVATGGTEVGRIILNSGAKLEETELTGNGFGECELSLEIPEGEEVKLIGDFEQIDINASNVDINIISGTIEELNVEEVAQNTKIEVSKNASINTLTLDAKTEVSGKGTIETANVNADGSTIEQKPNKVNVKDDVTAIVNDKEVNGGQEGNQNTGGSSSSGGGSSKPSNRAPVAVDDTIETDEDTEIIIDIIENDTDLDGDTLTIQSVSQAVYGAVYQISSTDIRYIPDINFNGEDIFTYMVSDSNGGVDEGEVTVYVNIENDAPQAVNDIGNTDEDTELIINIIENDIDLDGDTLTIQSVSQAVYGAVYKISSTDIRYIPDMNFNGEDVFTYMVSDSNGGVDEGEVIVHVNDKNDTIVAKDDIVVTNEDISLTIDVLINDTDADGDRLTVIDATYGMKGQVDIILDGAKIKYSPYNNENGEDVFTYTVSDNNGSIVEAKVWVSINAVNDAPVATEDSAQLYENTTIIIDVLANDSDVDGDSLSIKPIIDVEHGTVELTQDNKVKYTPDSDWNGQESFTYTIYDGDGLTAEAQVNIHVKEDKSDALVNLVELGDKVAGETFDLTISQAKDRDGILFSSEHNVTVITNQSEGTVYNGDVSFLNGNVVISIPAEKIKTAGSHILTVNIQGVTTSSELAVEVVPANPSSLQIAAQHGSLLVTFDTIKDAYGNKITYQQALNLFGMDLTNSTITIYEDGNKTNSTQEVLDDIKDYINIALQQITFEVNDSFIFDSILILKDEFGGEKQVFFDGLNSLLDIESQDKIEVVLQGSNSRGNWSISAQVDFPYDVSQEIAKAMVDDEVGYLQNNDYSMIRNTNISTTSVVNNLSFEDSLIKYFPMEDSGVSYTWDASNHPFINNSGVVTRPTYEEGDITGNVVLTLSKPIAVGNDYTDELMIPITVLAKDVTAPEPGNGGVITVPDIQARELTLNWTKAMDNASAESGLEYLAYYSTSNNIDTVANIEANGTAVGSFETNINSKVITGLTEETTYYFNIIVKDEAGNKSAYTTVTETTEKYLGAGTIDDPFTIYTVEDLARVGTGDKNWNSDSYYILMNDLDFNDDNSFRNPTDDQGDINGDGIVEGIKTEITTSEGWKPIGVNSTTAFKGKFDGNNHTIFNLMINRGDSDYQGLFGYLRGKSYSNKAEIKNLTLENVSINGANYSGGLVGYERYTSIDNCSVSGVVSGNQYVGGFVGRNNYSDITNSIFNGTVTSTNNEVGGFAGWNDEYATIENCSASGDVSGNQYIGGLVGRNNYANIKYSYFTGNVSSSHQETGGLVGRNENNGVIDGCYADSVVDTMAQYTGGLVGYNNSNIKNSYAEGTVTSSANYASGLVGYNQYGNINNCYTTATVASTSYYVGGLVGYNLGDVTNSYAATNQLNAKNFVGGLTAYNYGVGSITDSIAFSNTLTSIDGILYRVDGCMLSTGTFNNNYASSSMLLNGAPISSLDANSLDGADLSSMTKIAITNVIPNWEFDSDTNGDGAYWKVENDRPVLYVDPDGDGTFEKLGDDDGVLGY